MRGGHRRSNFAEGLMFARSFAVASLLLSIVSTGCHRGGFSNAPAGAQGAVGLVVQNQNFYDMDVYVVSEGLATRVGDVTGNSTARFTLDPGQYRVNVRLSSGQMLTKNITLGNDPQRARIEEEGKVVGTE